MLKHSERKRASVGVLKESVRFWPDFLTPKFSPHCAIGAVAAGPKSQPSAIALGWLYVSGETLFCDEVNFGPSSANHFDTDADVMTSTSNGPLRNAA